MPMYFYLGATRTVPPKRCRSGVTTSTSTSEKRIIVGVITDIVTSVFDKRVEGVARESVQSTEEEGVERREEEMLMSEGD
ncbi:hypothetical protein TSUD_211280 [Trifolium subterraneum]|uniref:Uncharacterized protein n=1 Tax=Trifolium subterraneum TaxID=3900 RepID=A0A2Z6MX38_TRISU|nr:hypothetical protein TSUD_211280 [Trifolium subterraneum]